MAAIYQWYTNQEIIYTTPLYPIEVIEGLNWAGDIDQVDILGVPFDELTSFLGATGGEIETVKIYGDAGYDADTVFLEATGGEIETVRLYADAGVDEIKVMFEAAGGQLFAARVEHIQPNEDQVHWDADITNVTRP
jgi:hypothetical protein